MAHILMASTEAEVGLAEANLEVGLAASTEAADLEVGLAEVQPQHSQIAATDADAVAVATDVDLVALHREAVQMTCESVRNAEEAAAAERAAMGARLRAEQARLRELIMSGVAGAVREAAAGGHRVATILRFDGSVKLDEFCYLYMLKGPYKSELRQEMQAMGVRPLLPFLKNEMRRAGFKLWHTWQRATNENTLTLSW